MTRLFFLCYTLAIEFKRNNHPLKEAVYMVKKLSKAFGLFLVAGVLLAGFAGTTEAATPQVVATQTTITAEATQQSTLSPDAAAIIDSLKAKGTPESAYKVAESDVDIVLDAVAFSAGPMD